MEGQLGRTAPIFSYRMVVDSGYKQVAQGRSRLSAVIFTQALIQFVAALVLFQTTPKGVTIHKLSISPAVICFISLLVGEIVVSFKSRKSFVIIKDFSRLEVSTMDVSKIASTVLGLFTQIYAIRATIALIHNMAPPKRAS